MIDYWVSCWMVWVRLFYDQKKIDDLAYRLERVERMIK